MRRDGTRCAGYAVDWVPSKRMAVDLSDLDGSRCVNLTGASGHAFHDHYDDQVAAVGDGADDPVAVQRRGRGDRRRRTC